MQFWRTVSGNEFVTASQEIAADPDFDTLRFIVVDFSGVKAHTIDEAALQDVAVIRIGSMATNPNVRIAMVTTDCEMATLTQSANVDPFIGTHEVKVFATLALAREWLQRQPVLVACRCVA
jgi:hypothetical protein